MSRGRVVLVGFDAMDPDIARGLAAAGRAPALCELLQTAAWAPTTNPPGLVVGGVWPSIWSGVWPSRHGFYCYHQLVNGTYDQGRTSPEDIDRAPFWGPVADAGRRVFTLDVPLTPLRTFPGCAQVVDWGTHDRLLQPASSPASVLDRIQHDVGPYALGAECDHYARQGAWRELRDRLIEGIDQRTRVTKTELLVPTWDLVMTVFSESHCAGHHLWAFHDPGGVVPTGDPLIDVYAALDRALHDLLLAAGPDATVVVLLSHGVGPHFEGDHLLAAILQRIDDSYGRPRPLSVQRERVVRSFARRRHERRLRRSRRPGSAGRARLISYDSSRRFYKVFNIGLFSGIRLNVRGREPRGRVEPGIELDELADRLSSDLLAIVDPDSGLPHVTRVLRTSSIYQGEHLDDLPDLLVEWNPETAKVRATSDRIGVVHDDHQSLRSGDHRPGGLVLVRGPGIRPGPVDQAVRAVDIAPTITAMLGVDLADTDGQPIQAFLGST